MAEEARRDSGEKYRMRVDAMVGFIYYARERDWMIALISMPKSPHFKSRLVTFNLQACRDAGSLSVKNRPAAVIWTFAEGIHLSQLPQPVVNPGTRKLAPVLLETPPQF